MTRATSRDFASSAITSLALVVACVVSACAPHSSDIASAGRSSTRVRVADVDFVQFRWEDPTARSSVRYIDPASGQAVALNDSVVLDIRAIDSAWTWHPRSDSTHWDVDLLLSRSGAAQFGATTATHVGQRLAIVVDGAITQMPLIQSALGPRAVLITRMPQYVADSLAARVNHAVAALRSLQPVMFPRDLGRQRERAP